MMYLLLYMLIGTGWLHGIKAISGTVDDLDVLLAIFWPLTLCGMLWVLITRRDERP